MLIIQFIFIVGTIIGISYLAGKCISRFTGINSLVEIYLSGFIFLLGAYQVLSTPMMAFHAPFAYALDTFWGLIACIFLIYIIAFRKQIVGLRIPHIQFGGSKFFIWAAILFVLAQAVVSSVFSFENPDDSFYVSSVLTTIDSPAIYSIDPTTGDTSFPVMAQYRYESWELFQAVLSKSFSIAPAVLAHTFLPFILILFAYLSYTVLARELLPAKDIGVFIIALSLFHLFSGYSNYSSGTFLLTRIWQGKSVLLHIGLPYLLAILIRWIKSEFNLRYVIQVTTILIFTFAFNPIAIFLPTLLIAAVMAICLVQNFRNPTRILLMALSVIPIGFYALAIRAGMQTSVLNQYPLEEFSLRLTLERFIGTGVFFYLLYLVGIIFAFRRMDSIGKFAFVFVPAILILSIWNPIFVSLIAKYITSYPTYWRLYWLFPLGIGLAYLAVVLFRSNRMIGSIFSIALLACGLISSTAFWQSLRLPENPEKLPSQHLQIAEKIDTLKPNAMVIAPDDVAVSLRQVSSHLRLFWSRQNYMQEFLDNGKKENPYRQRLEIQAMYSFNQDLTSDEILTALKKYKIELVIIPRDDLVLLEKLEMLKPEFSTKDFVVLSAE